MTSKYVVLACSIAFSNVCTANVELEVRPFYDHLSVTVSDQLGAKEGVLIETNASNGVTSTTNVYGRTTIPIQLRDSRYVIVNVRDNDNIVTSQKVWVPDYERSMFGTSSY
ncbi:hypothetical protein ACPV5L_14735 [Vibrio astriarenae]|jgi:hypothetical protein